MTRYRRTGGWLHHDIIADVRWSAQESHRHLDDLFVFYSVRRVSRAVGCSVFSVCGVVGDEDGAGAEAEAEAEAEEEERAAAIINSIALALSKYPSIKYQCNHVPKHQKARWRNSYSMRGIPCLPPSISPFPSIIRYKYFINKSSYVSTVLSNPPPTKWKPYRTMIFD